MKKIFKKVVSKSSIKEELKKVLMTKTHLVATDSFSLIEVGRDCFSDGEKHCLSILDTRFSEQILIKPEELDLEPKLLAVFPVDEAVGFPQYEEIMPKESDLASDYTAVTIDPQKLATMAQALADTYSIKSGAQIVLHVPKNPSKPVLMKRTDGKARGIVMPMNK